MKGVLNDVQRLGGGLERLGESEQLCGSGCSGTIQKLGKVLQGSEDVSNDVQGLERFGGSGAVWGKSASLACPRTLARTVELWGVRADVWEGVWRGGVWRVPKP